VSIPDDRYPNHFGGSFTVWHNGREFFRVSESFRYQELINYLPVLSKSQICVAEAKECAIVELIGHEYGREFTYYQLRQMDRPLIHQSNRDLSYAQEALTKLTQAGVCK
jgi:hypothetical protein